MRFPLAFNALQANVKDTRVMVIAKLHPFTEDSKIYKNKKNTNYYVADIAMMPVAVGSRKDLNGVWRIPFDSSHELDVVRKLMDEERCFVKPLRYDAHRDVVFPDFILTDTEKKVPMEVWGMVNNQEYQERRCEKTRYYELHFNGTWWEWDIKEQDKVPPFPEKIRDCFKDKTTIPKEKWV